MITLTSEILNGYISDFFWPFVRILALFSTAPLFSEKQTPKKFRIGLAFLTTAFINGMMLAMPLITLLLVLNLSLGILNRMTPQLSVFVVGFPLTLTIGMLALSLIMPALPVFTERVFSDTFNRITLILQQLVS
ncbi:TPA: flagellar biosynthetic protein FliR [Proteus mirabilis]|nr:flagellar biosynthetic protein FliR [Proteus mirabilis]